MLIKHKLASDVRPSEITPHSLFKARRRPSRWLPAAMMAPARRH